MAETKRTKREDMHVVEVSNKRAWASDTSHHEYSSNNAPSLQLLQLQGHLTRRI